MASTNLSPRDPREIVEAAEAAASRAYAPYSHFRVGAALRAADGTIVTGVNVENRSYGLTVCAERSAVVAAIGAGHRAFTEVAVYTPDADYPVSPCGACRQVLSEFMAPDALVVLRDGAGHERFHTIGELLPADALHDLKDRTTP